MLFIVKMDDPERYKREISPEHHIKAFSEQTVQNKKLGAAMNHHLREMAHHGAEFVSLVAYGSTFRAERAR